ncbi:MAG TPA: hypothetical protein DIS98_03950 [Colwellia sp.]|nr:hypothetical protein [Colwellia sp.]
MLLDTYIPIIIQDSGEVVERFTIQSCMYFLTEMSSDYSGYTQEQKLTMSASNMNLFTDKYLFDDDW